MYSDGDAPDVDDLRGMHLNAPIVGIASTPEGKGFWLAAADGGVFTFGNARFFGSAGAIHLNAPIVGSRVRQVARATGSRRPTAACSPMATRNSSGRPATCTIQALPFTTTVGGDTEVFSSPNPITIQVNGGVCATEVHADRDGRLIQRKQGSSYSVTVPAGSYWLSNTDGCTVSAS